MSNTESIDYEKIRSKNILLVIFANKFGVLPQQFLSLTNLLSFASAQSLNIETFFINENLYTFREKNEGVDYFLKSNNDYIVFINNDISFEVNDFFRMVQCAINYENIDILMAPSPIADISWSNLHFSVKQRMALIPSHFATHSGLFNQYFTDDKIIENTEVPTKIDIGNDSFVLIKKNVFEKFKNKYPQKEYLDDFDNPKFLFFNFEIDKKTKKYLSEMESFYKYVKKINIDLWMLPYIKITKTDFVNFKPSIRIFNEISKKLIQFKKEGKFD